MDTEKPTLSLLPLEARILGSLIEKELTTPEYYPLTLNALLAACNQKNNREPVLTLDGETLERGIYSLQEKHLLESFAGANARTLKYRERLLGLLALTPKERAVMCELLLRGPQTVGELRARAARLYPFATPEEVSATLGCLAARETGPLVTELPRQAGHKETRFAHLLGDQPPSIETMSARIPPTATAVAIMGEATRLAELENRVISLEAEVAELKALLQTFRAQFE